MEILTITKRIEVVASDLMSLSLDDKSFEELVIAGEYDQQNERINPGDFRIDEGCEKEVQARLLNINPRIGTDGAYTLIQQIQSKPFRPATTREILTFGVHYPDLQKEETITSTSARGEVWGHKKVLALAAIGGCRFLGAFFDGSLSESTRFLVIEEAA